MNMSVDLPYHKQYQVESQDQQYQQLPLRDHQGVEAGGDSGIPEDPLLAETHYSQFEDFEADESSYSDTEDDEYEAFLGCIEEALELPNQPGNIAGHMCIHTHTHMYTL